MTRYWIKPKGWRFRIYMPQWLWWKVQYPGSETMARHHGGFHS